MEELRRFVLDSLEAYIGAGLLLRLRKSVFTISRTRTQKRFVPVALQFYHIINPTYNVPWAPHKKAAVYRAGMLPWRLPANPAPAT